LVEVVVSSFESVGAGGKIKRGAYGRDPTQRRWSVFAELARQFCDQVATHGISREEYLHKTVIRELFENGAVIPAHPGTVESRREEFGAPAIALVEADHVEAAL